MKIGSVVETVVKPIKKCKPLKVYCYLDPLLNWGWDLDKVAELDTVIGSPQDTFVKSDPLFFDPGLLKQAPFYKKVKIIASFGAADPRQKASSPV